MTEELSSKPEKCFIVSLSSTSKTDAVLSLWRTKNSGYCWYREWSGVYDECELMCGYCNEVVVPCSAVEKYWRQAIYDKMVVTLLPNTPAVRKACGIKKSELNGSASIHTHQIVWWDELKPVRHNG